MVNDWLRRYDPVAWFRFRRPDLYKLAVEAGVDHDDILSACMEGLRQAAKRYDPAGGTSLSRFAVLPMSSLVMNAVRDHRPGGLCLGRGGRWKSPAPARPTRLDQETGDIVLASATSTRG